MLSFHRQLSALLFVQATSKGLLEVLAMASGFLPRLYLDPKRHPNETCFARPNTAPQLTMARRSAPKRAVLSLCVALAICTFAAEAFLGGVVSSFRRSPRELRAKAEEKKPPPPPATFVSSKPKSAPEPVASPLDVIKKTRVAMSKELEALASEAGVEASNKTRSDLQLRALIEEKVQPLGQASTIRKKLEDLESRLVRTELALIAGDATKEATDFDLAAELAEANAKIKALEMRRARYARSRSGGGPAAWPKERAMKRPRSASPSSAEGSCRSKCSRCEDKEVLLPLVRAEIDRGVAHRSRILRWLSKTAEKVLRKIQASTSEESSFDEAGSDRNEEWLQVITESTKLHHKLWSACEESGYQRDSKRLGERRAREIVELEVAKQYEKLHELASALLLCIAPGDLGQEEVAGSSYGFVEFQGRQVGNDKSDDLGDRLARQRNWDLRSAAKDALCAVLSCLCCRTEKAPEALFGLGVERSQDEAFVAGLASN
eukprot:s630_g2.t1